MVSKRGQAVLISLQNVRSALLNGKTLQWRVLSGEGHCITAMARMACISAPEVSLYLYRGLSSAGRAPDLHSGGQRFDPVRLHQDIHKIIKTTCGGFDRPVKDDLQYALGFVACKKLTSFREKQHQYHWWPRVWGCLGPSLFEGGSPQVILFQV